MASERMEEVEVAYLECDACCVPYEGDEDECRTCGATAVRSDKFPVLPGSLTAARLRLADAAEAKANCPSGWLDFSGGKVHSWPFVLTADQIRALADLTKQHNDAKAEYEAALAALRTKRAGE